VIERSIGDAGFGAVGVGEGALYVRPPRLPKLDPLPGRASAAEPSIATAIAIARTCFRLNRFIVPLTPTRHRSDTNIGSLGRA
jgi:hypothetical protein